MATIDYKQKIIDYMNSSEVDTLYKSMLNNLFPELAENESAKIRKEIVDFICWTTDRGCITREQREKSYSWIAWLEKQGEQKPLYKIKMGKEYKCIASPRYSTFMTGEIYKPEDKFLCSLMNFCSDCFEPIEDGEQKPTDKVEPKFRDGDWIVFNDLTLKKELKKISQEYPLTPDECIKPAWSEEDKTVLNNLIYALANDRICNNRDEYVDWLKSLKERYTWKPSDEQIKTLEFVIESLDNMFQAMGQIDNVTKPRLKEVLVALKKLRDK